MDELNQAAFITVDHGPFVVSGLRSRTGGFMGMIPGTVAEALLTARTQALAVRRTLHRWLRHAAERAGSDRYSHPALYDIDRKIAGLFPGEQGYFVEVGGGDGYRQSNTYYLERFCGWTGVLVEPIPELYRRCRSERSRSRVVNAALVADDKATPMVSMRFGDLMSIIAGAKAGSDDAWLARGLQRNGIHVQASYDVEAEGRTLTSILADARAPSSPNLLILARIHRWAGSGRVKLAV